MEELTDVRTRLLDVGIDVLRRGENLGPAGGLVKVASVLLGREQGALLFAGGWLGYLDT